MQKQLSYKLHYFVCETCSYCDENDVQCLSGTAKAFRKSLKEKAKGHFSKSEVRVNGSGCLGQCEHGIASVLYPRGEFRNNLRPGDEDQLIEWLKEKHNK
jgi:predicted metal-binding protein